MHAGQIVKAVRKRACAAKVLTSTYRFVSCIKQALICKDTILAREKSEAHMSSAQRYVKKLIPQ